MTGLLAEESMALAEQAARRVLAACGEGDMLRTQLAILRRLSRFTPADTVGAEPRRGASSAFSWSGIRFSGSGLRSGALRIQPQAYDGYAPAM